MYDKRSHAQTAWWQLGKQGRLQPLSEDFLYRSVGHPGVDSYRRAPAKRRAKHVDE